MGLKVISSEFSMEAGLFLEELVVDVAPTLSEESLELIRENFGFTTPLTRHLCPPNFRDREYSARNLPLVFPIPQNLHAA